MGFSRHPNRAMTGCAIVLLATSTHAAWDYEYFEGTWSVLPNFGQLTPVETGTVSTLSLSPRNRDDLFGFRFTGDVTIQVSGNYRFGTTSDDGSRVWIDGQLVVDNDGLHAAQFREGTRFLTSGVHFMEVTFFESTGGEILDVVYAPPGTGFSPIPSSNILDGPETAADFGSWDPVIAWPEIAISAATLPDGRILTWSSTELTSFPANREFTHASVFDPSDNSFVPVDNNVHDMFCAGISTLEDGTVVASGGNPSDTRTSAFNPFSLTWSSRSNMNFNRWYGTNLTLPTNQVFSTFANASGNTAERFDPDFNTWTHTPGASMQDLLNEQNANNGEAVVNGASNMQWWSKMSVMPDGRVFHGGPTQTFHIFDPSGVGSTQSLGQPVGDRTRMWSNAVTYDIGKLLLVGGADRTVNPPTTNAAYVVDLNNPTPQITAVAGMIFPRAFHNSVTLPTGDVLVIGGSTTGEIFSDNGAVFSAELWDPATEQWQTLSSMDIPRTYHSIALLLKDGRVLSAGGGACGTCAVNHQDGQIFSPPYLFQPDGSPAARPGILSAASQTSAGASFSVQTSGGAIASFSLIRLSGTTHATNTDQRFVPVGFTSQGGGSYTLTMHSNPNALLPGYYWLFAVNSQGVPSIGNTIQVTMNPVDSDGDGVPDSEDAFPNDPTETMDTDGDGVGDNSDAFPNDPSETADSDGDGVGDNSDAFPSDPNETADTDGDGVGDNSDAFPNDPAETSDCDGDGIGDNADPDGCDCTNCIDFSVTATVSFATQDAAANVTVEDGGATLLLIDNTWRATTQTYDVSADTMLEFEFWSSSEGEIHAIGLDEDNTPSFDRLFKVHGTQNWGISGFDNYTGTDFVAYSIPVGQYYTGTNMRVVLANDFDAGSGNNSRFRNVRVGSATSETDSDGDGVPDSQDAFPNDPNETSDTDGDGVGDNGDAFPTDPSETSDTDGDGIGDNTDLFPTDPTGGEFRARSSSTVIVPNDQITETVWNVNPDNGTVTALDLAGSKLNEIDVGDAPWALAKAPLADEIWVANKRDATLSVVDTTTLQVDRTLSLPAGSQPHGLVFAPGSTDLYVVLEATGDLYHLNAATDTLVRSLSLGKRPRHVAINASGESLYVSRFITPPLTGESTLNVDTSSGGGEVLAVDTATLALVDTYSLSHASPPVTELRGPGLPNYLGAPVISADGATLFVPHKQDNILAGTQRGGTPGILTFDQTVRATTSIVDLVSGVEATANRIHHDNSSVATGAVMTPDGDYLLVALETSREVAIIDMNGYSQVMRVAVGRAPQGLALSGSGRTLIVHNFMDRTVGLYDIGAVLDGGLPQVSEISVTDTVASEELSSQVLAGKKLFYDAADDRLALDNYLSCASCHNEGDTDGRVWDFDQFGEGLRGTISLQGKGIGHGPLHWSANFDEVQDFERQIREFAGGTGLMSDPDFAATFDPLGPPKAGLSADLDALAAYLASLTEVPTNPNRGASLSADAQSGRTLAIDSGCVTCHSAPNFTDSASGVPHDIGTITPASGMGSGVALTGIDTPTLLGVWNTGPYLHDGSADTIEEAIAAHAGLSLTAGERADVASLLRELEVGDSFEWTQCTDCIDFSIAPNEPFGNQDQAGNVTVEGDGSTLLLTDNTWRRTTQSYTVTPDTIVELEFSSSSEGEIHGIGFDENTTPSSDRIFRIYGTQQAWGIPAFADYPGTGAFVGYRIPVGSYYTGTSMRLVFVNDFDAGSGSTSRFRNVRVFEHTPDGDCPDCIDFLQLQTVSYSNQDEASNFQVKDGGAAIVLTDNTWRRSTSTFAITASTVLEFDFESTSQGEIHGIGFDENNSISSDRIFQLYGTQTWGIGDFANYAGGVRRFSIPVGQHYTGSAMFLILVNDNDGGSGNNGRYSSVRLYEP